MMILQCPSKTHLIRRVLISITACLHPHPLSQPQLYRHTAAARGRVGTTELGAGKVAHNDVGRDTSVFLSAPNSGGEDKVPGTVVVNTTVVLS